MVNATTVLSGTDAALEVAQASVSVPNYKIDVSLFGGGLTT